LTRRALTHKIAQIKAEVAELADALGSGSSGLKLVGVRVPPSAPSNKINNLPQIHIVYSLADLGAWGLRLVHTCAAALLAFDRLRRNTKIIFEEFETYLPKNRLIGLVNIALILSCLRGRVPLLCPLLHASPFFIEMRNRSTVEGENATRFIFSLKIEPSRLRGKHPIFIALQKTRDDLFYHPSRIVRGIFRCLEMRNHR
jgi:hypothetical protein